MIDGNDFENSQTEKLGRKQISRADPAGERLFGSTSATALTPTVPTLSDLTLPPPPANPKPPLFFFFRHFPNKNALRSTTLPSGSVCYTRTFIQFYALLRLPSFRSVRYTPDARFFFFFLLFIALPSGAEDDVGMRERSVAFFCLYFACVNA